MKNLQKKRETAALFHIWSNRTLSRGQIADILNLKPPTVSALVSDLIKSGRVVEGKYADSSGGRRAKLLEMVPFWGWIIGLEFSSRGIISCVADMNGDLYNVVNTPISMQWDKERILQNLRDAIRRQIQYAHRRSGSSIFRIGVATSGLVDETSGVSINFPRLEDWKDIPLRKILEQDFQVRTIVENRITAVTYAENLFGAKKDTRDALIFQLGPGLGMGMILGGHVRRGTKWSVGEFGHIAVTENGPLCYCGKRGCLESVASDFALVAQALQAIREGVNTRIPEFVESDGEITAEAICKAAEDGDRLAHGMIERVGHFIATGVANLLNVLGPEVIMFSGTMVESSDVLLDCIRRNLRVHTLEYIEKNVQVTRATFGANSGIQGAVTIALQDFFSCTE
ncbi:MAG TPA: ROK family transcriptional regulator [Candidatus Sumerlaeota bacterium]|nr:ROK family transcriptional regulator [Candidatus Sumerlaeota bacterium]